MLVVEAILVDGDAGQLSNVEDGGAHDQRTQLLAGEELLHILQHGYLDDFSVDDLLEALVEESELLLDGGVEVPIHVEVDVFLLVLLCDGDGLSIFLNMYVSVNIYLEFSCEGLTPNFELDGEVEAETVLDVHGLVLPEIHETLVRVRIKIFEVLHCCGCWWWCIHLSWLLLFGASWRRPRGTWYPTTPGCTEPNPTTYPWVRIGCVRPTIDHWTTTPCHSVVCIHLNTFFDTNMP